MEFGATHKKKNTYIVKVNNLMADTSAFGMCQNTPLPVIVQNGQRVQNGTGAWMRGTNFPNPAYQSTVRGFSVDGSNPDATRDSGVPYSFFHSRRAHIPMLETMSEQGDRYLCPNIR